MTWHDMHGSLHAHPQAFHKHSTTPATEHVSSHTAMRTESMKTTREQIHTHIKKSFYLHTYVYIDLDTYVYISICLYIYIFAQKHIHPQKDIV